MVWKIWFHEKNLSFFETNWNSKCRKKIRQILWILEMTQVLSRDFCDSCFKLDQFFLDYLRLILDLPKLGNWWRRRWICSNQNNTSAFWLFRLIIHGIKNSLCLAVKSQHGGSSILRASDLEVSATSVIDLWLCTEDCRLG